MAVYDKVAMDAAAVAAEEKLRKMPLEEILPMAKWFKENFMTAGHKRLGRIVVKLAKEQE